jgi:glyoxylate reductase
MKKPKVYVTREIAPESLDMISEVAEIKLWTDELAIPHVTLLEQGNDIDGLLCLLSDKVDAIHHQRRPLLAGHC